MSRGSGIRNGNLLGRRDDGCCYGCGGGRNCGRRYSTGFGVVTCLLARCGARRSRRRRARMGAGQSGCRRPEDMPVKTTAGSRRRKSPRTAAKAGPTARGAAISMADADAGQSPHTGVSRWAQGSANSGRGLFSHAMPAAGESSIALGAGWIPVAAGPTWNVGKDRMGKFRTAGLFHIPTALGSEFLSLRLRVAAGGLRSAR